MRNFIQPGNSITVTAPYAVSSGQGVLVGAIFGIAAYDAALGGTVEVQTEGVFDITKEPALAITVSVSRPPPCIDGDGSPNLRA